MLFRSYPDCPFHLNNNTKLVFSKNDKKKTQLDLPTSNKQSLQEGIAIVYPHTSDIMPIKIQMTCAAK